MLTQRLDIIDTKIKAVESDNLYMMTCIYIIEGILSSNLTEEQLVTILEDV